MSQTALAGADFSASFISLVEADKRVPSPAALAALAARLGVSVDELTGASSYAMDKALLAVAQVHGAEEHELRDAVVALRAFDTSQLDIPTALLVRGAQASAALRLGEVDEGVAALEAAVARARSAGAVLSAAAFSAQLVDAYRIGGDVHRPTRLADSALAEVHRHGLAGTGEHVGLGVARADALLAVGRYQAALEEALGLLQLIADVDPRRVYRDAAQLADSRGRHMAVVELTRAAAGDAVGAQRAAGARAHLVCAEALLALGPTAAIEAAKHADQAAGMCSAFGDVPGQAQALAALTRARTSLGEPDDVEDMQRVEPYGRALLELANAAAARAVADGTGEEQHLAAASAALSGCARTAPTARAWMRLAASQRARGASAAGVSAYRQALAAAGLHLAGGPAR